jgi:hypothetical protein
MGHPVTPFEVIGKDTRRSYKTSTPGLTKATS